MSISNDVRSGPTHVAAPHAHNAVAYNVSLLTPFLSDRKPNRTLPIVLVIPIDDTKNDPFNSPMPEVVNS